MNNADPATVALFAGDLLIRSGLISVEQLQDAVSLAEKTRVGLGRVLEMNCHVREAVVSTAIEVQGMIDKQQLTLDVGIKAVEAVAKQEIQLETALRQICPERYGARASNASNKLGELLSAAGVINPLQLEKALYNCLNTKLPLGMVLIQMQALTRSMLAAAVTTLRCVRKGMLPWNEAVQCLRVARLNHISIDQCLSSCGVDADVLEQELAIGYLLLEAGILTEAQLLAAMELQLIEGHDSLSVALTKHRFTSKLTIKACQQVLKAFEAGFIPREQTGSAIRSLSKCQSEEEAIKLFRSLGQGPERMQVDMIDLLKYDGFVSQEDLDAATPISLAEQVSLDKALVQSGCVEEGIVRKAWDCKTLIEHGLLCEIEQACIVLQYAVEMNITAAEALEHFGWNRQTARCA